MPSKRPSLGRPRFCRHIGIAGFRRFWSTENRVSHAFHVRGSLGGVLVPNPVRVAGRAHPRAQGTAHPRTHAGAHPPTQGIAPPRSQGGAHPGAQGTVPPRSQGRAHPGTQGTAHPPAQGGAHPPAQEGAHPSAHGPALPPSRPPNRVKCRIVCKWSLFLYVFTGLLLVLPAGGACPSVPVLPCPDT